MKIIHLVQRKYESTSPEDGITGIKERLLKNSFLVVIDNGTFLGILTPSDIVRKSHQLVIDCLYDTISVDCNQDIESVLELMKETGRAVLPVFEKDNFIGVVTRNELLEYLIEYKSDLNLKVRQRTAEISRVKAQLQEKVKKIEQIEETLKDGRDYLETLSNALGEAVFTVKMPERVIECVNHSRGNVFGYTEEECVGQNTKMFHVDIDLYIDTGGKIQNAIDKGMDSLRFELPLKRKNGEVFPAEAVVIFIKQNANVTKLISIIRDITERKLAGEKIKAALKEKEVLLQEIHHRVKNNLQIISSLLDMRIMRTDNQQVIGIFEDVSSKIQAMAIMHSQLYQSERVDSIDMDKHIRELFSFLSRINNGKKMITPVVSAFGVYLSIEQALPCALILSELISNAFKHAFEDKQRGVVKIFMKKSAGNMIIIRVKDDGIGIPDEIDIHETDSMGMKLVRNIVQKQLKGEIRAERSKNRGTEFIIAFKIIGDEV